MLKTSRLNASGLISDDHDIEPINTEDICTLVLLVPESVRCLLLVLSS